MPLGKWLGDRGRGFVRGWSQHPWQHVVSTVAGMAGGPLAGQGVQAAFDARNRGVNTETGNRGQALGQAMQDSLNQRIFGNSPQPMTENYGPWAGGYRGASMPQQPSGSMSDTLGLPDYNQPGQVPNSPSYGVEQGSAPTQAQGNPMTSRPMGQSTGQGGGIGHGWSGTSDAQMMGMIMDSLGLANAGTQIPDAAKVWISKAVK